MQIKPLWKRTLWHLDQSLDSNQAWRPLLWPLALGLFFILLFWLIGLLWPLSPLTLSTAGGVPRWVETTALFLNAGQFPLRSQLPFLFQALIAIVGTAAFTALFVAILTIVLTNRLDNYRKGLSRYYFENHILVLGGSREVVNLFLNPDSLSIIQGQTVLILTEGDARQLREYLLANLPDSGRTVPFVVYHGQRTNQSALRSCQIELASHIFILGEDNETDHDSLNIACWNAMRHLRSNATQIAQCFLYVDQYISGQLLRSLPQESHTNLETTVINRYENIARQTLIRNTSIADHLTLDRLLLAADSHRLVHLVIVGMTPMGAAFATTAAQICHFPNFNPADSRPLRTRITFIDPRADLLIDNFKTRYQNLFNLSHITLRTDASGWQSSRPDNAYGDFLDIEWEFLKGHVSQEWIRDRLTSYTRDENQVLSISFCNDTAQRNLNDALSLPPSYFSLGDSGEPNTATPVVFIYQPGNGTVALAAQNEIPRYHNLVPFGMNNGSIDPFLSASILRAKRYNYVCHKVDNGKTITTVPSETQALNSLWCQLSIPEKSSAIHAGEILPVLMRNTPLSYCEPNIPIADDSLLDTLARISHQRWMTEMLLEGYAPMPADQRRRLNQALLCDDEGTRQEAVILNKRNASLHHILKDIAPYDELPDTLRQHYRTVASHCLMSS